MSEELHEQTAEELAKECVQLGLFPFIEPKDKVGNVKWKNMRIMTDQQRLFVLLYLETFNAYKSALKAGYSEQYARQAWQIMKLPHVREAIDIGLKELHLSKTEAKALISDQARANMSYLVDEYGSIDLKKAVENGSIRYVKKITKGNDGRMTVELVDSQAALDKVLKIHKLYSDEEIQGNGSETNALTMMMQLLVENSKSKSKKVKK